MSIAGRGWVRLIAAPVAIVAVALSTLSINARAQSPALVFPDGKYSGSLIYTGAIGVPGQLSAFASANGAFSLEAKAGDVPQGYFWFNGKANSVLAGDTSGGSASLTFFTDGAVVGPATGPMLQGTQATYLGTAEALGIQVPVNLTLGPEQLAPITLTITSATCTKIVGDFTQQASQIIGSQGINNALSGRFTAVRVGSLPPAVPAEPGGSAQAALDQKEQLILVTENLVALAKEGQVDTQGLHDAIAQAEALVASVAKNTECKILKNTGAFNLEVTGIIADLLAHVVADPDGYATADLFELVLLGLQVGAIGEGAADTAFSNETIAAFKVIFGQRLDAAIADDNAAEITQVGTVAAAMGWNDLLEKATNAL